jgi:hypothetical protein
VTWLLDIYLFFRDFERDWGSRAARRKTLGGCLGVFALIGFAGFLVFIVITARGNR